MWPNNNIYLNAACVTCGLKLFVCLSSMLLVSACLQGPSAPSPFEVELVDYVTALGLPAAAAARALDICRAHDFSAARVHLIISRPGAHTGALQACLV